MKMEDGHIYERIETLFVNEELKLFFLTGQPSSSGRRANIQVQPFNALDDGAIARMREQATPWKKDNDDSVTIAVGSGIVTFRDTLTGTQTIMSRRQLEPDFSDKRLAEAFRKYAAGPVDDVTTERKIMVGKPFLLRKPSA